MEFVDYGNRERTSIWNVKKLTDDFLVLAPQAIKCCLESTVECNYDEQALALGKATLDKINHVGLVLELFATYMKSFNFLCDLTRLYMKLSALVWLLA